MQRGAKLDFTVVQGKTYERVLQWAAKPVIFKEIAGIAPIPSARLTVIAHGLVNGWMCAVVSAPWLKTLNAKNEPPESEEYFPITVIDDDTIEFNGVNSAGWSFKAGGWIRAYTAVDLSPYQGRMHILDRIGGTVIVELTTENGGIVLDNVSKNITLVFKEEDTIKMPLKKYVYDLELYQTGEVKELSYGIITSEREATV